MVNAAQAVVSTNFRNLIATLLATLAKVPVANVDVIMAVARRMQSVVEARRLSTDITVTYIITANSTDSNLTTDYIEAEGGDAFLLSLNDAIASDPDLLAEVGLVTAIRLFGSEATTVSEKEVCIFDSTGLECHVQIVILTIIVMSFFACLVFAFCFIWYRYRLEAKKEKVEEMAFMSPCATESTTRITAEDSKDEMAMEYSSQICDVFPELLGPCGSVAKPNVELGEKFSSLEVVDEEVQQKESEVHSISDQESVIIEFQPKALPSMFFPAHETNSDVEFYSDNQWISGVVESSLIDSVFHYNVYYGRKKILKQSVPLENLRQPFQVQEPCSYYAESTESWLPGVIESVSPKSLFPSYTVCVKGLGAPVVAQATCLRHRFTVGDVAEVFLGGTTGWVLAQIVDVIDQPSYTFHTDILVRFRDGTEIFFPSYLARQPRFTM